MGIGHIVSFHCLTYFVNSLSTILFFWLFFSSVIVLNSFLFWWNKYKLKGKKYEIMLQRKVQQPHKVEHTDKLRVSLVILLLLLIQIWLWLEKQLKAYSIASISMTCLNLKPKNRKTKKPTNKKIEVPMLKAESK